MADPRFRSKEQTLNAFDVSSDDPQFLRPREFTFIFFSPSLPRVRLLYEKHENYQQGTIQFNEFALTGTEYLGRPCVHCKEPLSSVGDCCLAVNDGQVVATVHESCFRKWFNDSDKGSLSPYRLARCKRRKICVEGGSFKVQINNGDPVEEYTFSAIQPVTLEELAHDAMAGTMVQQGSFGFSGTPPQGIAPEEYMRQMSTMVPGQEATPPPAAAAAAARQPDSSGKPVPWAALPPAGTTPAKVSHSIKVEGQCPHCQATLVITIETKD